MSLLIIFTCFVLNFIFGDTKKRGICSCYLSRLLGLRIAFPSRISNAEAHADMYIILPSVYLWIQVYTKGCINNIPMNIYRCLIV